MAVTEEQRLAVDTRHVSVALSAGAGCGKTHVLTERFLSELERAGSDDLGRFVAITFTDRAAREMRDRIRRNCRDRLLAAQGQVDVDRWMALWRELDSARISTIHSFCGSLLRSHAVEAGLDPRFTTLDAIQSASLLAGLLDDQLRRQLTQRKQETLDLVVEFGLDGLRTMLSNLLSHRHQMDFAVWQAMTADDVLNVWESFHRDTVLPELLRRFVRQPPVSTLLGLLEAHDPTGELMRGRRAFLLDRLPGLPDSRQVPADLVAIQQQSRVQGGKPKTDWPDMDYFGRVKEAMEEVRDAVKKVAPLAIFVRDTARPAAEAGLKLVRVAAPLLDDYEREKRSQGLLDFDDLLIHARRLLCDPAHEQVRRRVEESIEALLVDESQDTDPLQVDLVRALCGERLTTGKLFFVGDYKQSIYRFRRADPQVFRDLRAAMPEGGRLSLTKNFRSQPDILDFVNALFADDLGPEYEPLRPSRDQVSPRPCVEFLWVPPENPDEKDNVEASRAREARWIARRLWQLLDGQARIVWDEVAAQQGTPAPREIRPGDIALLFRALPDVAVYEKALQEHEIPYYLVGGSAFYAQQEVFDLLNLLRSLASPCDVVSLAGVLRSPFFSLADETLYRLAQHRAGLAAGLYAADLPPQLDEEQTRRAAFAAETLGYLRSHKDRLPVAALIREALARTGYDALLLAEFLGERKLANLHKLLDQARGLDQSGLFTLDDYITQLAEFVADQPKEPLAATHPEKTDVVRLMSIHQAKGLEFPLVVVPDLERGPPGNRGSFAFRPNLGPLVKLSRQAEGDDPEPAGATGYDLHVAMETQEEQDETLRLLYVATTRAADYLILSSGVKSPAKAHSAWRKILAKRFCLETGNCTARLPAGWAVPKVAVTTSEPPEPGSQAKHRRRNLGEIVKAAGSLLATAGGARPLRVGPVPADAAARRQYSFSRLSGALRKTMPPTVDEETAEPAGPRIDPLALGHLVHDCLAVMPFGHPSDVASFVHGRGERRGSPPHEIREAVAMIERFLATPRAKDLSVARQLHRELEFLLAWPPDVPEAGGLYLQGFFDCLYQDQRGRWQLLDYKTNQVSDASLKAVAEGYEMQMLVYGLAVEQSFGQPPESMTLHFLRTGQEVRFQLDDAARAQALLLVNLARSALVETDEADA